MPLVRKTIIFAAALLIIAGLVMCAGCYEYDTTIEPTPIHYDVIATGHGRAAKEGDVVRISFRIEKPDGTLVMEDDDNAFQVGGGSVIKGIDEAVRGMKPGEKRRVKCPPHLHWGRIGYGGKVPPNTWLTFHIRMLEVK